MLTLKQQLHRLCLDHVIASMQNAEAAIADARDASHNETKSSAGDKYETAREMMQQEIDMATARLNVLKAQQQALQLIDATLACGKAIPGSLVQTNNGNFYVAISAGKLVIDGVAYYAVSIESPIGVQMKGKSAGDKFVLNGKGYAIASVT